MAIADWPKDISTVYLGQYDRETANEIAGSPEDAGIFWWYKEPGYIADPYTGLHVKPEPLPVILRYRVVNPDAVDYGRVGVAVDTLDEEDGQQRTVWVVLELDGLPVAFHKDELMRVE